MKKLYLKNEVIKKTFQDNQRMVMDAFIPIANTNLEFTGNSLVYVVDYKDVTASTSPLSVYLKTPTQFKVYGNQGLTRVNRLPVTYKMETMRDMFTLCFSLNFIDFSNWNTSNVKTMYNAFASTGFEGPDGMPYINNLDLRSCADLSYAFSTCINLFDIDLSNWQLGSAQTTEAMFYGDSMLRTADLRNWNTSTITNMSRMFENCNNLTDIYIDNWNTSNVQNMSRMFANCSGLDMQTLIDKIDFSSATDISYMFMNCKVDGDTLDLSDKTFMNWDGRNSTISGFTSGVTINELKYFKKVGTNVPKIGHISTACTAVDFSNWDTSNITNMSGMFYNLDGTSQVKKVTFGAVDRSTIQDIQTMFYRSIVEELDSKNMVFPNLTNVYNCFNGASGLTSLDLRGWNMSQVNNLGGLFSGCTSLEEVNLSGWDLSHLTDTRYYSNMFRNCPSLAKIYACDCNQATISVLTSALQTAGISSSVLLTECQDEPKAYAYVETNEQWELSTVDGGEGYTTFQSFSNKGVSSTTGARLRIKFSGSESFDFKYRSEGWSTYIYLCVGDVDVDLSNQVDTIRYNTTGVKYNTRGNSTPNEWKVASYENLDPAVEHFIDVIYIKTYGASFNEDRGFISLNMGEILEKWEASTSEFVTVGNDDDTYTFYTLDYKYISVDDGKTWIPTTTSRQGETELQQMEVAVDGYLCENGNKYAKNQIYVDVLGNWLGADIYTLGKLLEEGSEECQVQELEWIANTVTQTAGGTKPSDLQDVWFDLNVPIKPSIMFQIDFTSMYRSGGLLVGNRMYHNTDEEWRFFTYTGNNSVLFDNWKGGGSNRVWPTNCIYVGNRYNLEVGNFYIKDLETGSNLATGTTYDKNYGDKTISIWCGTEMNESSCGAKIHSLKIYDDGVLIKDLVPALRKDNVAGLLDKLDGTFYEPQGTGTPFHSNK